MSLSKILGLLKYLKIISLNIFGRKAVFKVEEKFKIQEGTQKD